MPSHYTSVPTQTRFLSSAAITSSYCTLFSICPPSRSLEHFFIVIKFISFFPPGPPALNIYTLVPLVALVKMCAKNVICNFFKQYNHIVHQCENTKEPNPMALLLYLSPSYHSLLSLPPRKTPPRFTLLYPQCSAGWPFV